MAGMGSAQLKNPIYKDEVNTNEVENEIRNQNDLDPWQRTCEYTNIELFTFKAQEAYVYRDDGEIDVF